MQWTMPIKVGSNTRRSEDLLKDLEDTNRIADWDDGFTPSGCNEKKGRMVIEQPRSTQGLMAVVDGIVPDDLAQAMYDSAVESKVWGEYINRNDIDALISLERSSTRGCNANLYRKHLAACAVHSFFREKYSHLIADDWKNRVHGVSVWVIASDVGDSVQYHIDYAEMFRFQTNVIYPPMYGGTLHLTHTKSGMKGGEFCANLGGLSHYQNYRYKCPLDALNMETDNNWIKVPYKYNRGTLCDGDFPHFSAPVTYIPDGKKRVIVGFNVCNHEIGPIVEEYPEHSAKFNKFVKLSQTAGKFKGGLTVEAVKKNPKLAAFVKLLAKKKKELDEASSREQERKDSEEGT